MTLCTTYLSIYDQLIKHFVGTNQNLYISSYPESKIATLRRCSPRPDRDWEKLTSESSHHPSLNVHVAAQAHGLDNRTHICCATLQAPHLRCIFSSASPNGQKRHDEPGRKGTKL